MTLKTEFHDALTAGLPIFIGYFPAAVAFGIMAKTCGLTLMECFLFSAVVFAGASQFIALNLLMTGTGPLGIILTTLLVNFRHFLMSASLSTRLSHTPRKFFFPMAFGVTDEVFSVLSFKPGQLTQSFIFTLQLCAYSAWVSGTLSGYLLGEVLPDVLAKSMPVALYALLLAILLPEIKKSYLALILAFSSGALNSFLAYWNILPKGWCIIVCVVIVALIGSFFIPSQQPEEMS